MKIESKRVLSNPALNGLFISIVAVAIGFLIPPSLPLTAILFLICGGIGFFRTSGLPTRPFWGIVAMTGLIILLIFGTILLFGLAV